MKALYIVLFAVVLGCGGADVLPFVTDDAGTINPVATASESEAAESNTTPATVVGTETETESVSVDISSVDTNTVDTGDAIDTTYIPTVPPDTGTGPETCGYTCVPTGQCVPSVGIAHRNQLCPDDASQVCCELITPVDTGTGVDTATVDTDTRPDCEFVCLTKGTCPASGVGKLGVPHSEMACGDTSQVCCDDHSQDPLDTSTTVPIDTGVASCSYTCTAPSSCPSLGGVEHPEEACPDNANDCCDLSPVVPTDTGTSEPVDTGTGETVDTGTGEPVDTGTGDPVDTGTETCALEKKIEYFNNGILPTGWERSRHGLINVLDNGEDPLEGYYVEVRRDASDSAPTAVYVISPSYSVTGCSSVWVSFSSRFHIEDQYDVSILVEWDGSGTWYPTVMLDFYAGINAEFAASYYQQMYVRGSSMRIRIQLGGTNTYVKVDNFRVFQD